VRGRRRVQILAAAAVTLATAVAVAPPARAGAASVAPGAAASTAQVVSASAVPGAPAPPALGVRGAILVAGSTGQRLYGTNADAELPIASTTKLMTALVTLERAPMTETFPYPGTHFSPDASQIELVAGERMSVQDLLTAMLLPSADDAAEDLAYNIGSGSVSRLVAMMNARAVQLGPTHTHYSTPIGLGTPGHYSSAAAPVKLAGHPPARDPGDTHAYHLYIVRIDAEAAGGTRDEYQRLLSEENIATSIHFLPVHELTAYRELLPDQQPLPVAERAGSDHPDMIFRLHGDSGERGERLRMIL